VLVQLKTRLPPFSYIEYISFMRYGLEAFYVAEAQHWTQVVELMGTNFIGTDPDDPGYILSSYGYDPGRSLLLSFCFCNLCFGRLSDGICGVLPAFFLFYFLFVGLCLLQILHQELQAGHHHLLCDRYHVPHHCFRSHGWHGPREKAVDMPTFPVNFTILR